MAKVKAMEEKHNWLGPYIPEGSFLKEVIQQVKLAYYLLLDPRVNPLIKLIPLVAVGYLLLPTDIIPDVIPVVGQLDDLVVIMLGLRLFFEFAPPSVVQEHLRRLVQRVQGDWSVVENSSSAGKHPPDGDEVVDDGE
jgi:uncharacterized membrane protein YkvA (DUF1232 family)